MIVIGIGDQKILFIRQQDCQKILDILDHTVWMDWLWHFMLFILTIHLNKLQLKLQIKVEIVILSDRLLDK